MCCKEGLEIGHWLQRGPLPLLEGKVRPRRKEEGEELGYNPPLILNGSPAIRLLEVSSSAST